MKKTAEPKITWSFTAHVDDLAGALSRVLGAVEKRATIPSLSHVKLDVLLRGCIQFAATDLEVRATTECRATVPGAGGSICVPADLLKNALAKLSRQVTVTLHADGRLILSDHVCRFDIVCLPGDEFPEPSLHWDAPHCHLQPGVLPRLLRSVLHAASTDDTKYHLRGVYLCQDQGRLTAVATDGHRLSLASVDLPGVELPHGILIPAKAVRLLLGIDNGINLATGTKGKNDNQVLFDADHFELAVRLLDAQFPDYRRVIPAGYNQAFTVPAADLAQGIDACAILNSKPSGAVTLTSPEENLGESITISALSDSGVATATVPSVGGCGFAISASAKYLAQALKALSGEVFIKHGDTLGPVLMVPVDHVVDGFGFDERLEVVMPMRV